MTEAATQTATTETATQTEFTAPAWLPGVDTDTAKFIVSKTVADLPSLAKGYAESQRALSSREFVVPQTTQADAWAKINAARGVPESADKYDLGELKAKVNADAVKPWLAKLHAAGVPNAQAQDIISTAMTMADQQKAAADTAFAAKSNAEMETLKTKWGVEFDKNADLAQRGMTKMGELLGGAFKPEDLTALEKALGTERFMNMALIFGRHTVESGFVMSDGQHVNLSREGAAAARAAFQANEVKWKAFWDQNSPGNAAAKREWAELGNIANG